MSRISKIVFLVGSTGLVYLVELGQFSIFQCNYIREVSLVTGATSMALPVSWLARLLTWTDEPTKDFWKKHWAIILALSTGVSGFSAFVNLISQMRP